MRPLAPTHFFDVAAVIEEGQTVVVSRGGAKEPPIPSHKIKPAIAGGYKTIACAGIDPVSREPNDSSVIFNDARTIHLKVARWSPGDSYRILIRDIDSFIEDIELLAVKGRYYASREACYFGLVS
jgi:hypothetical protein